jgi:transposase
VGRIPAKADPDNQAASLQHELEPRRAEAQAGQRAVFFMDAAHVVLAPFLGFLWSPTRVFLRAPAGRQRFNVLGALTAVTPELLTVTNDTSILATEVCQLLRQLAALHLGVPLTVVLDHARSQRCAPVVATAASLQIELCFLPPYSPNLNLIERLWKFVKKQCLYSSYTIDTFSLSVTLSLTTHPLYAAGRKYAHYGWHRPATVQRVANVVENTEVTPYGKEAPSVPSMDGASDSNLPSRPRRKDCPSVRTRAAHRLQINSTITRGGKHQ